MKVHLLKTNCGRVDVLHTVGDGLTFEDLIEETQLFNVADFGVKVLNLETIIATKEQAGRPKDQAQLPFLKQLLTEIRRREIQ